MAANRLQQIAELGQAVWLDNLSRGLLEDGVLERLIADDGLTGVTSNPTIFKKAIVDSDRYDEALRGLASGIEDPREAFFQLAYHDVRDAADLLRAVFDRTAGKDGYVSFELPPGLAYDADASIAAARRFRAEIDRANVFIKVPGTAEGVHAFEELTARGQSINVTLLFAVARYEQIAEAYLRGLERRVQAGDSIEGITSVASFFVSRVDTKVDAALDERGRPELKGRAAVANARIAYQSFERIFSGERWQALAARGAHVQRPLWASTSTKNPDYPDTLYVDELIGPETVNTMPDATIEAARDHARVQISVTRDVQGARKAIAEIEAAGVDVDDIVCNQLVTEGVDAFAESFDDLVQAVAQERARLAAPAS